MFEVGSTNIFPNGINLYRLNELRSSNERDFVNVTDINAKFSLVIIIIRLLSTLSGFL